MGHTALWDMIKHHEEAVPIAQLAEDHHRRHGKPLRIAVDEADWRFNNLTMAQVYIIRDTSNEQASQGIEKAMFHRICRLLTLNMQLIFVFDSPGRPWKRGKREGGRVDYEERRILTEMLKGFGISYHEAPGEAEAECARLQVLGMVDAVWSQDSDCLMFGCTLWIYDDHIAKEKGNTDHSKENTRKNAKIARVVQARDMKEKHGLDREGLVLFAMLAGGDYDEKGLLQCGPSIALQAVKKGLGHSLCAARNQADCGRWSAELAQFLQTTSRGRSIAVPTAFPDYEILKKYHKPKVSSDELLLNSLRLRFDYARPIQELKLLEVTSSHFNIWGRQYMNWVGPVLLTQFLTAREQSLPRELVHQIKITKRRVKKTDDQTPARILERKLSFSPFGVTTLQRKDFEGDHLGYWDGTKEEPFDPEHRVECEMPEYWLQKLLPPDVLDPPPAPKRTPKRKRQEDDAEHGTEVSATAKRKRKAKTDNQSATRISSNARSRDTVRPALPSRVSDEENDLPILGGRYMNEPSRPHQRPEALPWDIPDEDDENLQLALRLSMQEHLASAPSSLKRNNHDVIFAMREAGREVHGLSVPSWSLDQTSSHAIPFANPRASIREVRAAPSYWPSGSARVNQKDVIGAEPVHTADWAFTPPPATVLKRQTPLLTKSGTGIIIYQESSILPSTQATLVDVRAARLRHFASSPAKTMENISKPLSPLAVTAIRPAASGFQIPAGADCIDLTDD
ncbi:PIN domain-like protein [Clathrospora elynae]|uniref:PIN domain-like protein n=1 Tax=Clathrospora elynae TaxID=706981 RepID=A0A6A5SMW0_9PLEO|nr:PIN domain-like protein [Clathrospora elynae]